MEIYTFLVRALCEMWSASCSSKHAPQTLSDETFCAYRLVTGKLQVLFGRSTNWMTALLSEMTIFWIRPWGEIWLASNGSIYASHSLSFKPLSVYTYTSITWNSTDCIRTLCILNDSSTIANIPCVIYRVAWEIQLVSYNPRHVSVNHPHIYVSIVT